MRSLETSLQFIVTGRKLTAQVACRMRINPGTSAQIASQLQTSCVWTTADYGTQRLLPRNTIHQNMCTFNHVHLHQRVAVSFANAQAVCFNCNACRSWPLPRPSVSELQASSALCRYDSSLLTSITDWPWVRRPMSCLVLKFWTLLFGCLGLPSRVCVCVCYLWSVMLTGTCKTGWSWCH
jgi:hypothetical protein